MSSPVDIYADAFVAPGRWGLESRPVVRIASGLRSVAVVRVLVTDDAAYDDLVAEDSPARWGVVMAFEQAPRCNAFLRGERGWKAERTELAMVLPDIASAADATLSEGLELRSVPDGVSLLDVATAAIASDPDIPGPPEEVARFLGGLPRSASVFAAVDGDGVVHGTAAAHVFGEYAQIFFVATEPGWRRRGVGSAMTLGALKAAASRGARTAILHSTEAGVSVYAGLGFESAGMVTRYACVD